MDHRTEFPVEKMSKVLGVSRSGYYRWSKAQQAHNAQPAELNQQIQAIFDDSNQTYGSPRITQALQDRGIVVSKSTVARRMQAQQIGVKRARRYVSTTQSNHHEPIAPNVLDRDFSASRPAMKWVSDITYFRVNRKWYYLTVIIDLADRYVVGWTISDYMGASATTLASFQRAVANRSPQKGLLFHSDRGVQYACGAFRDLLKRYQVQQSMSRKANCWDNAVAESFFKTIKTECLNKHHFTDGKHAYTTIFRYIEGWYNTRRIHSANGGLAPAKIYQQLIHGKAVA